MARKLLTSFIATALLAAFVSPANAGGRPDGTSRSWFGQIGTGWAFPTGDSGDFLDDDWTIGGGAMYWPSDWAIGIALDVNYAEFDLSSQAISDINDIINQDPANEGQITGGSVENWQFALSGIWSLGPQTDSGLYLTGGISWNRLTGRVTDTGLVYYPPICDPWYWWWCIPGGVGPGTIIVGKRDSDEFGWNIGAGYSWKTMSGGKIFVEARYQQITVGDDNLDYIPLTVGYRF
jgi:opacity protein-like surface antigen